MSSIRSTTRIGTQETIKAKHIGSVGVHTTNHYDQILREEIMVKMFYTNIFFFFAGEANVYMPYSLRNFQFVVLVQCTHSSGRELRVGTSMEQIHTLRALKSVIAARTWYHKFVLYISYYSAPRSSLKNSAFLLQRGTQNGSATLVCPENSIAQQGHIQQFA